MKTLRALSFAKINLGLKVLSRRPDGYHEIQTRLQTIDLADEITFQEGASFSLTVAGGYPVPEDESNLVMRAARAMSERYPGRGARIVLKKSIPPGSGLGGGSSNAAVTLLALDRLWGVQADPGLLYALARRLGSDVPFFLYGGTCLAVERGEEVLPMVDVPFWHVLVVWPGVGLSTREVYEALGVSLTRDRIPSSMSGFVQPNPAGEGRDPSETKGGTTLPMQEVETCVPEVGNDLEEAAFKLLPLLGTLKQRLVRSGALAAALTGSGSALFGIHASAEDLQRSAASLAASLADEGAAVFACRTLTRDEYHRRMFTGTRK